MRYEEPRRGLGGDIVANVGSDDSDATDVAAVEAELCELDVVAEPPESWDPALTPTDPSRPSGMTDGRRGGARLITSANATGRGSTGAISDPGDSTVPAWDNNVPHTLPQAPIRKSEDCSHSVAVPPREPRRGSDREDELDRRESASSPPAPMPPNDAERWCRSARSKPSGNGATPSADADGKCSKRGSLEYAEPGSYAGLGAPHNSVSTSKPPLNAVGVRVEPPRGSKDGVGSPLALAPSDGPPSMGASI